MDLSEWDSKKWPPLLTLAAEPYSAPVELVERRVIRTQRQNHLDPAAQLEVVAAYQAGASMNEVARAFKMHRTTVVAILKRHGVPQRPRVMSPEQVQAARELYESGLPLAAVGERLGFNGLTIANRLRALGVQLRGPNERPSLAPGGSPSR